MVTTDGPFCVRCGGYVSEDTGELRLVGFETWPEHGVNCCLLPLIASLVPLASGDGSEFQ
jgi:hypothetical protein